MTIDFYKISRNAAKELMSLQKVSDGNRNNFISAIDGLDADGGTCLGEGLKQGLIVSNIFHNLFD